MTHATDQAICESSVNVFGRQSCLLLVTAAAVATMSFWFSGLHESDNHALSPFTSETPTPDGKSEQRFSERLSVGEIVDTEKLILDLAPKLSRLARAVQNLRLPDQKTLDLFADQVDRADIVRVDRIASELVLTPESLSQVGPAVRTAREGLAIWQPFFEHVRYFSYSAEGNLLFRNDGSAFSQVAGLRFPAMNVAKVGWSFGGQFADVDNDGWLDIYVPSGFYSAPGTVSTNVDL